MARNYSNDAYFIILHLRSLLQHLSFLGSAHFSPQLPFRCLSLSHFLSIKHKNYTRDIFWSGSLPSDATGLFNVPRLPTLLKLLQNPHVLLAFDKVQRASERPKVVRTCGAFNILTWKCVSRHNGVHCFDVATSKSCPTLRCFAHLDLETRFVPQQRALFPKVVRAWYALHILTSKCASPHNSVHFFDVATSKSCPTLRCFVHLDLEMCFAPQQRALFQKWSEPGVLCAF